MEDKNQELNNPEMNDSSNAGSEGANAAGKVTKKALTTRGIILIGIGGLLAVLLIVGAAAWYTRVSVINQMSMDAAKFDFKANYTDENFIIRAQDYVNIWGEEQKAAPGTAGVIPILVQADDSDVDVSYILSVNTDGMDPWFKRRIRFFYIPKDATPEVGGVYDPACETEFSTHNRITGTLKPGEQDHYEYIYWEWVYDLNQDRFYIPADKATTATPSQWYINDPCKTSLFTTIFGDNDGNTQPAIDAFDKFDTEISQGKYNDKLVTDTATYNKKTIQVENTQTGEVENLDIFAYQQAMQSKIDITGALARPTYEKDADDGNPQPSGQGTYGSQYVNLAKIINNHNTVQ